MKKQHYATLVTALLALSLFLYTRYLEKPAGNRDLVVLYSLKGEEIRSFEIIEREGEGKEGERRITLTKTGEGLWKIFPGDISANPSKVVSLLENFSELKAQPLNVLNIADDTAKMISFGLDKPSRQVLIQSRSGPTRRIFFGKKNPVSWNVYMQIEGGKKVYLMPEANIRDVTADVEKWKIPETKPEGLPDGHP